ncbi:MAG TPA: hypothetical protein VFE47_20185 [Tepidisphaeraceae bacterium]|jgi:hypothetical protein|nr:hypothetical protein [Tepidisphaeraceae bacterium]
MPDGLPTETSAPTGDLSSRRGFAGSILTASVAIAAIAIYAWLISGGTIAHWHTYTDYYDLLARGFLRGQTHLVEDPAPALLKLADPYDPNLNEGLRLHDASLYRRHYYLYWGPFPALLLAIVRLFPFSSGTQIGDQYLVFAFAAGLLAFNALLLMRIRRIVFPEQPAWTAAIALLAAAFAAPVVYMLGHASIYEAAIMGGQCFLVGGFYFVLRGLEFRPRAGWLAAGGFAWGCAIACRFNLIAPIGGVAILALWRLIRLSPRPRQAGIPGGLFMLPLILSCAALLFYNEVRFGSPLEFGTRYQLTWLNGFGSPPANVLFSAKYVEPNLNRMWLEPMDIVPEFPFLRCGKVSPSRMIREYHLPREYFPEPLAGFATSLPFAWLALIAPLMLGWRMLRGAPGSSQSNWLTLTFLISSLLAMVPILFVLASTMRYLADVAPSLILLAAMGMWQANQRSKSKIGGLGVVLAGAIVLAVGGALIGLLLTLSRVR